MNRYSVAGRSAATAATADNAGAALWNPSTAVPIFVKEVKFFILAATVTNPGLVRITTRGTATLTVTPDIDSGWNDGLAPPSGALLDLTYSAQPIIAGPYLDRTNLPAAIGSGFIWVFEDNDGLKIKPGQGLAIATPVAVILGIGDVTFGWRE